MVFQLVINNLRRIAFISLLALSVTMLYPGQCMGSQEFDIMDTTIEDINKAFAAGHLTSEQLVQMYLKRIEAYEEKGPGINALITLNPNALARARRLDRERKKKGRRSLVHGIPFILKDNYGTADMPTTAGSVFLRESVPTRDAYTTRRLRDAGAIVIGKANMSEFGLSYSRFGYSSLGGHTRNPHNLKRNASGSSSGSAAAVAANFAIFATGTDTAGSIRAPASVTGVVGIRPTLGLTSRSGVVPVASSFDATGPIARTVRDTAIALQYMAGVDKDDPRTLRSEGMIVKDYTRSLDADALKGARLGIARDHFGANPDVDRVIKQAIATMRKQGAKFVDVKIPRALLMAWEEIMDPVIIEEMGRQVGSYLRSVQGGAPRTFPELVDRYASLTKDAWGFPVDPERLKAYGEARESRGVANTGYLYTLTNKMPEARNAVLTIMKEKNLDAIVFPTMPCPASPRFTVRNDRTYVCTVEDPYVAAYLSCITGFPEITVPAGMTRHGLPVGLSFFGRPYSEPRLFGLSYAFEQATNARKPPVHTPRLKHRE